MIAPRNHPLALTAALVGALLVAPVALALDNAAMKSTSTAQGTHKPMVSKLGVSVPYLLHQAYVEAIHANEAIGLGVLPMAENHLDNVAITLGAIDLDRTVTDKRMRSAIQNLRDEAQVVGSNPTAPGGDRLVEQFVSLFEQLPSIPAGGGGGMGLVNPAQAHTATDWVAMAYASAADAQVDVAMKDYRGAQLNAQHTVLTLDLAKQSAQMGRHDANALKTLDRLRQDAARVTAQIQGKSPQAAKTSGQLVTRIGRALPMIVAVAKPVGKPIPEPGH